MNFTASAKSRRTRGRYAVLAALLAGMSLTAVAAGPAVHTVVIDGMQFTPANLEIRAGDTVIWKNKDPFPHTATVESGAGFDSGEITAGGSWKFIASKRGTFSYVCTLHRTMKGQLVVK